VLKTGIIGTVVAAICCFTPLLVILFGAAGLGAAVGYLDVVLIPALVIFVGITVVAIMRRARA
jgi:mercuric ion transport protein